MDWARYLALAALLLVAILVGGAAVRAAVIASDPRSAVVLGLVGLSLVAAVAAGARGRRRWGNPYW